MTNHTHPNNVLAPPTEKLPLSLTEFAHVLEVTPRLGSTPSPFSPPPGPGTFRALRFLPPIHSQVCLILSLSTSQLWLGAQGFSSGTAR